MGTDTVGSEHVVRLFDVPESLGESVAAFFADATAAGASMLLVAKPVSIALIAEGLAARGLTLPELVRSQRLTVLDAETMLCLFMRNGAPDAELFERHIAGRVRELAAGAARLAIYGEMVEILAAEEDFRGAAMVEALWNRVIADLPVSLLCGYSSAHFATPDRAAALRVICASHSHVQHGESDLLGNWLLDSDLRRSGPTAVSPIAAAG